MKKRDVDDLWPLDMDLTAILAGLMAFFCGFVMGRL